MNTQTDTNTQASDGYKGGSLNRIQAQWVADWLKRQNIELPSGWTSIWRMNAKQVSLRYKVLNEDVIKAGNGLMR